MSIRHPRHPDPRYYWSRDGKRVHAVEQVVMAGPSPAIRAKCGRLFVDVTPADLVGWCYHPCQRCAAKAEDRGAPADEGRPS
jgi:hypothetical protein